MGMIGNTDLAAERHGDRVGLILRRWTPVSAIILASAAILGCSNTVQFSVNEVELLKLQVQQQAKQESLDTARVQDVVDVLTALFGTPDDPQFPYLLGDSDPAKEWVRIENLRKAGGAVSSDRMGEQRGLYREHCAQCHGITGNGSGPTSAFLDPYPRDFRLGKFKYKSTKLGQRPTDEDLRRVILNGIPGTAMPSFRTLDEDELLALIDYVKYLAIRGRVEYKLLAELPLLDPGERLIDMDWRRAETQFNPDPEGGERSEQAKTYDDQLSLIVEIVLDELDQWNRRPATLVPEIPSWLAQHDADYAERVHEGRALFSGKANCAMCHGFTGLGDGQTENFDDWTNQWVKGASVDPRDSRACAPFIDAGAFPPRAIRPRNLRLRVYRGGDHYSDLYRRIAYGIEGTGMPDSSALTEQEIWSLVGYVLNLPYEEIAVGESNRPPNETRIPSSAASEPTESSVKSKQ